MSQLFSTLLFGDNEEFESFLVTSLRVSWGDSQTTQENLIFHVLRLLVRAYDDTDLGIQEEVLKNLRLLLCNSMFRVNALLCFGVLVHTLDKYAVLEILQTIHYCTAVDCRAPALMCTPKVANSIFKQYGVEFVAEYVLPLLFLLLTFQQLNVQQFAKYMLFVKDILRIIEKIKTGVSVTDSGIPEVMTAPFPIGLQSQALSKTSGTVAPASKSSSSWDEDWGPVSKGPTARNQPSTSRPL
ncbi:hypothetical protein GH714_014700 [Hevea brasiliensis]|uniref:Uncharacterized protein n=1 Tax=Hevea brasiliensis TaxID=3981 RepID=A0A6A6KRD4_HEVBR|nr:hypothetical protein GH714_014700 [Hevea brasiliensis]